MGIEGQYIIGMLARITLNFCFAYYLITLLQWYNYNIFRVIFMHHKRIWHLWFFIIPALVFWLLEIFNLEPLNALMAFALVCGLTYWRSKQDKPLKFTKRVQRFFGICLVFIVLDESLNIIFDHLTLSHILPLIFSLVVSNYYEKTLMHQYVLIAKDKLESINKLKIIAVTASFGKTSIKNYLTQILGNHFSVYATPRSVNTLNGIVADVNDNLERNIDIYIAEAGARMRGDIAEIANFLNPQYAIIGEIGAQHLEYFKSIDNITNTKFELLTSNRLKHAFVFSQNELPKPDSKHMTRQEKFLSGNVSLFSKDDLPKKHIAEIVQEKKSLISFYPRSIRNVCATLEGTSFEMEINEQWHEFRTDILGVFNVQNLAVCIDIALEFGMSIKDIKMAIIKLEPTAHRLQKIQTAQKLIIDDSFNGNLKGMLEAIRLASLYNGRKVIVTPGIVESNDEMNITLAKRIDEVFDIVIITGSLNAKVLRENIKTAQKFILQNKESLEQILKVCSLPGDIVLFSNDAPSFI